MPATRVAIPKGEPPTYKQAIIDGIYSAQLAAVQIKEGDHFMAPTEHDSSVRLWRRLLGIKRTDDLVQIQVFWAPEKSVDATKAMCKSIVENLGNEPGVRPEDILTSVFESSGEN